MKEPKKYTIPKNARWIQCKCGKEITFVMNEKGTTIPVTKEGINHFIDCPDRDKFRKKKMEKLKTLKDFRRPKDEERPYTGEWAMGVNETCDALKQEAIKWIKELEHTTILAPSDVQNELVMRALKDWIKHFFNIIEEDLK